MNTGYTPETISAYAQRMTRIAARRRVKLARKLRMARAQGLCSIDNAELRAMPYGALLRACRRVDAGLVARS